MTGTITLTGAGSSGTIDENALRGGVIDVVGDTMTTNLPIPFEIAGGECVKSDAPFYAEWVGAGKPWDRPDCWCYERNCRGDADGLKPGMFWVETGDLDILLDSFNIGDKNMTGNRICGDFDHKAPGMFRVETDDLDILLLYFNIGDKNVPVCPPDWDGDLDDDYNLPWLVP